MEKSLEVAWVGPQIESAGVSGIHQDGANSVSQVDGDSDIEPACACRGRAQHRNKGFCQVLLSGIKLLLQSSSWSQTIQFLFICPSHLSSCCSSTGVQSLWVCQQVNPCMGPLSGMPGTPDILCLLQPLSLLVFTVRNYRNISSWQWNPELGGLVWGLDHLFLRGDLCNQNIPPDFLPKEAVWPAYSTSPSLLPVSMRLLLYIITFRTSVHLDFRQFSKIIVL